MDEQVGSAVEDASGRIRQVVQRIQALCQMERAGDIRTSIPLMILIWSI